MEPLHLQISTNLGKNQKNTGNTNYKPVQGKLEKEKPTRKRPTQEAPPSTQKPTKEES
jgi:hypothetical protein